MFSKEERSSFKYWFAHWCAFQMVALNCKCWKFRFLIHDIEKPWLKLILRDYYKVQKLHRKHNKHHVEYFIEHNTADYLAMVIDWECSRFTKEAQPLNARQELENVLNRKELTDFQKDRLEYNVKKILNDLDL